MINYIWLDDKTSIKNQLPSNFKSVAIILNPFIQMPIDWEHLQSKRQNEKIYPSNEEIIRYGKPALWSDIEQESGLKNHKELALALKTSIGALKNEYSRSDLEEKINLREGIYYPNEDFISVLLIEDFLKILSSKGANNIYFSAPINNRDGMLQLSTTAPLEICDITDKELILTDENLEFAFMSFYDSFITLFLAKEENISNIIQTMNWEAFICDNSTKVNWYL